eukprot:TRINITY_DN5519_c0_g1_i3.p1 TRINITY_DN5519_c0_g1~~TRINITY_DN5519_c0_g1_i3.p1  ORF type:complete len:862 (+),score=366.48 TRINITY_DN5519_c0_g1_i3:50-2587(+)
MAGGGGSVVTDGRMLASIYQYLTEGEVLVARRVCAAWDDAAASEAYWGMRCQRDGVGCIKPAGCVGNEDFYKQFGALNTNPAAEGPRVATVDWLMWYDTFEQRWFLNDDLVSPSPVSVVTAFPSSAARQPLHDAARFLNACLRASSGGFVTEEVLAYKGTPTEMHEGRVGIQMWSQPASLENGSTALLLLPRGATLDGVRRGFPAAEQAEAAEVVHALQALVFATSSTLLVFDDDMPRTEGAPDVAEWWQRVVPRGCAASGETFISDDLRAQLEAPLGSDPSPDVVDYLQRMSRSLFARETTVKGPRLHVVSRSDNVCLPDLRPDAQGDGSALSVRTAAGVASWLAYFSELAFLPLGKVEALAEDVFGLGSAGWGAKTSLLRMGALWHDMACLTVTLPQHLCVLTSCVAGMNEASQQAGGAGSSLHAMKQLLVSQEFGEKLAGQLLITQIDTLCDFYKEAVTVELDNASKVVDDMAHRGQTSEPPADVAAPLWAIEIIQYHEQHFFTACRRLMMSAAEAGVAAPLAVRHFEVLKNKISEQFLTAWCVNQRRSKEFCKATFSMVFKVFADKYLAPEEQDAPAPAGEEAGEVDQKTATKVLKRFYQTFMDLLDEYEIKAIGTRRGDVMLSQTKDLLQRIQDSAANSSSATPSHPIRALGGMRLSDLSLAVSDINAEVMRRVQGLTKEMETSRNELQKTCALYTKLLGMQFKERIAACRHRMWDEAQDAVQAQGVARVHLFHTVLGLGALSVPELEESVACYSLSCLDANRAAEKQASEDAHAFIATLPVRERLRYHRFGVITENSTSGAASPAASIARLHEQAHVATGKITTKAKSFFSRFKTSSQR